MLKELAFKIKTIRKEQGVSQVDLAKKSGVSYASIKRFEQTGQIALEALLKILHVLERLTDFESILLSSENKEDIDNLFSDKTRK